MSPTEKTGEYQRVDHEFDVVTVVPEGKEVGTVKGCGEQGFKTACLMKVFPIRSNTVVAEGKINAALGNMTPDGWRWHM